MKHPKGLYLLFTVEMWERFNYYGMRAILALFMTSAAIGFSKATSSQIYGGFTALVYLTPLIGGYLADRLIGKRHSVAIGAIVMAMGQFTLASYDLLDANFIFGTYKISFAQLTLFSGLLLIIIGNGFFKPNISSIVGELYEPNDNRRDSAFTIFYMGINLGALAAPFVCGALGQGIGWKYGFMAAGTGMIFGLIIYLVFQKRFLGKIGLRPAILGSGRGAINHAPTETTPLTKEEKNKIKAIFVFTFFAVFFFAFFEQAGTSLTFFADEATRLPEIKLFGLTTIQIRSSFFQAINPVFVLILAPLFSLLWGKMGKREPSTPAKFGWGLFLQGIAFAIISVGASVYLADGKPVSMLWLVALYFFCTTGELCLSPIGLSMATKLAPAKFMSLLMGVWLMSSFFGNLLAGFLASFYETWELTTLFSVPAGLSIVFSGFMWIMSRKVKMWMGGIK
ncbi:MAG: peptide MFS transporter [Prevotellaceae bacterium]|jgi:POT family proton-dependent oligopeptide transporter|nr:peptide MFS transporter [Prevotellaceae bacterium]